jgi:hypothetical protein
MPKLFIVGSLENKFFIAKSSLTRLANQKPEKKSIAPAKKRGWVYGRKVIVGDCGALAGEGNKGYAQEAQKDKVKAKRVPLWHKSVPKEHGKGKQKDHNSQIYMSHQGMIKVSGRGRVYKELACAPAPPKKPKNHQDPKRQ